MTWLTIEGGYFISGNILVDLVGPLIFPYIWNMDTRVFSLYNICCSCGVVPLNTLEVIFPIIDFCALVLCDTCPFLEEFSEGCQLAFDLEEFFFNDLVGIETPFLIKAEEDRSLP